MCACVLDEGKGIWLVRRNQGNSEKKVDCSSKPWIPKRTFPLLAVSEEEITKSAQN